MTKLDKLVRTAERAIEDAKDETFSPRKHLRAAVLAVLAEVREMVPAKQPEMGPEVSPFHTMKALGYNAAIDEFTGRLDQTMEGK